MKRLTTLMMMVVLLPCAALAEEPAVPAGATDRPTTDASSLVPNEATEPVAPVEQARHCGAHGGCCQGGSKARTIVIAGVAGAVITAIAVGVAVGVARSRATQPVTTSGP